MNVKIGKNMLGKLDGYLKDTGINNLYIITDENINRLYYNLSLIHI